jgi:hypothetical protein
VVGDDRAQIRFLEQRLSTDANKVEAVRVERVTDDMLAGYEGKLYHVSMKHKVVVRRGGEQEDGLLRQRSRPIHALNTIIWKSIKGADSPMPPPVHRLRPLVDASESTDKD